VRVLVDHQGNDVGNSISSALLARHLKNPEDLWMLDEAEIREELVPSMLQIASGIAGARSETVVAHARKEMATQLEHEISRLKKLQKVNRSVRQEEIELLVQQYAALDQHLTGARLRLDAMRLIQRGE
jgi:ATP-dependent helicase HepA